MIGAPDMLLCIETMCIVNAMAWVGEVRCVWFLFVGGGERGGGSQSAQDIGSSMIICATVLSSCTCFL